MGTGVQLESVRKETGVEEVQTAGGHRIRSLVWRGSGRCCDVCRGSWDEAAGIFFFFFKMGDAPFFFSSNDPVSREVMMSQERVELNSQEGGNT